jgi:hypothetical protein
MLTKSSVQQRLCQAIKLTGQNAEYQAKLKSAEFSFVIGNLYRANALLSEMGLDEEPVSGHAKTEGALQRPTTPLFDWKPFKAPCEVDHTPHQARGGKCHSCGRFFYRGNDIQG